MTEIESIIASFETMHSDRPWYGIGMMQTLKEIPKDIINLKPQCVSHSIAQLVRHIINWRLFTIEKMKGNPIHLFEENAAMDWPTEEVTYEGWHELIGIIETTANDLVSEMKKLTPERMDQTSPGSNYKLRYIVNGIVQHDIYHLGQVRQLHKIIERHD
ncbi:MAG: DinB family protein [Cyclobacteriaceae bacterium]